MYSENLEIKRLQEENKSLFEELKRKKLKLSVALKELEEKNRALAEHNKELGDSVKYAKRIQMAIMPPRYYVNKQLKDNFILYMPKDLISGDFYFIERVNDEVVFAAVDCTGHGVPGALMSIVGFNYLDQAVNERGITKPCDILSFLDEGVNDTLRQTAGGSGIKDGMDLGICNLNTKTSKLQYAGAYNPMYIINKSEKLHTLTERDTDSTMEIHPQKYGPGRKRGERSRTAKSADNKPIKNEVLLEPNHNNSTHNLFELKADKLPIGVNPDGVVDIYTNHTVQLNKGDTVYLFSDGYADQFGGPHQKKFMYKNLKDLLLNIQECPMPEQKRTLVKTFNKWKGDSEQIDDVMMIGVRV